MRNIERFLLVHDYLLLKYAEVYGGAVSWIYRLVEDTPIGDRGLIDAHVYNIVVLVLEGDFSSAEKLVLEYIFYYDRRATNIYLDYYYLRRLARYRANPLEKALTVLKILNRLEKQLGDKYNNQVWFIGRVLRRELRVTTKTVEAVRKYSKQIGDVLSKTIRREEAVEYPEKSPELSVEEKRLLARTIRTPILRASILYALEDIGDKETLQTITSRALGYGKPLHLYIAPRKTVQAVLRQGYTTITE